MKNKTILSLSMWLLVVFLGIYYFGSQNIKRENEISSVEKSSHFLKEATDQMHKSNFNGYLFPMYGMITDRRDSAVFAKAEKTYVVAEEQYQKNDLEWKHFEKQYPVENEIHEKFFKENDSFLSYSLNTSKPVFAVHKLYLYQEYTNHGDKILNQMAIDLVNSNRISITNIKNEKIALTSFTIFNPEPIQYYLK